MTHSVSSEKVGCQLSSFPYKGSDGKTLVIPLAKQKICLFNNYYIKNHQKDSLLQNRDPLGTDRHL